MSERVLEVTDLAVAFHGNELVRGVDFHIGRGETVALVGESGSGKSATALSVMQLLPFEYASHPRGSIKLNGEEVVDATEGKLSKVRGEHVAMVFQEPMTSLNPTQSIQTQFGDLLFVHRAMSTRDARKRTLELLHLVGLPEADERLRAYPHELAGGQRQRVMLAMALANEPDLLIADELTTGLDVTLQAQILKLLADLKSQLNLSLLLISHDLAIVRKMADRVYVMRGGVIVEQGLTSEVLTRPTQNYTKMLVAAVPSGEPVPVNADTPRLMTAENLTVTFKLRNGWLKRKRSLTAVRDVSVRIRRGRTLGIVGESGSGKTTLAMALLRLQASEGQVQLAGRTIHGLTQNALRPLRKHMQIVFQDPFGSLPPRQTVNQIVETGLNVYQPSLTTDERRIAVCQVLTEVGFEPNVQDRYPHEFSGGERQRISIARALIVRPDLIILDEATSALDTLTQAKIINLLRELQRRHCLTYLFISHDLKVVKTLAHDLIVMQDGTVVERGPIENIVQAPQSDYTKRLVAAAFELEAA